MMITAPPTHTITVHTHTLTIHTHTLTIHTHTPSQFTHTHTLTIHTHTPSQFTHTHTLTIHTHTITIYRHSSYKPSLFPDPQTNFYSIEQCQNVILSKKNWLPGDEASSRTIRAHDSYVPMANTAMAMA